MATRAQAPNMPPASVNTMGGAQGFFAAQARAAVEKKLEQQKQTPQEKVQGWLGQQAGASPGLPGEVPSQFGVNTMQEPPARPQISGAAAKLLAKTANEKMAGINNAINETNKMIAPDRKESATETPQTLVDPAVLRAQEAERRKEKAEKNKLEAMAIKVTVLECKHLPKMDTFGKTDAYCVVTIDNKKAGGRRMKRKTQVVKSDLDPEFFDQWFVFNILDYATQEIGIEVWDWDAGKDDEKIGRASISLAAFAKQEGSDEFEAWYEFRSKDGPIYGLDGSISIVRVRLERNVDPSLEQMDDDFEPDPEEIRELNAAKKPWESAVRGLMFDIENHSEFPVLVTGLQAASGRGRGETCTYTIYRTTGTWDVDRCNYQRFAPWKYMICCCGSFPSGKSNFGCKKRCCRYTPCGSARQGCCCWGECGPGVEIAEPCCEGCIPCCTGDCVFNMILVPCVLPFFSCGCGYCAGEDYGGLGTPGIPALRACRCCGCECCRNGVHRMFPSCFCCCGLIPCYCTCNSTCCSCCRGKYHDRRRWTRVCSGRADLPSDWGKLAHLPSMQDFESGGVLLPPKSKTGFYIHTPYPEERSGEHALAIRGPFTKGLVQNDVSDQDDFLKIRTGPCTMHPIPFANSHRVDSRRDGQYYRLANQKLDRYKVCAFVGKVQYIVLQKDQVPQDCVTLCSYCHPCC